MVSERKHVRFAENQAPPKPPRRSYSPPLYKVDQEEPSTEENGIGHALISNNNTIGDAFAAYCSGVTTHLPTSKTFPMADKDLDFGDDFVPRTYAMARQVRLILSEHSVIRGFRSGIPKKVRINPKFVECP